MFVCVGYLFNLEHGHVWTIIQVEQRHLYILVIVKRSILNVLSSCHSKMVEFKAWHVYLKWQLDKGWYLPTFDQGHYNRRVWQHLSGKDCANDQKYKPLDDTWLYSVSVSCVLTTVSIYDNAWQNASCFFSKPRQASVPISHMCYIALTGGPPCYTDEEGTCQENTVTTWTRHHCLRR